ncbi:MAG: hypothetical protein KJZ65_04310 [Phycisphaerales bacterium]|nr:hypothetical protein [Phycisphaerales bacterium]
MSDTSFQNDPGIELVEQALDALGRAHRAQPDAGFEARILDAVQREVLMPQPLSFAHARERSWWRDRVVLASAASMLIVASIALMLWSSKPSIGPVPGPIARGDTLTPAEEVDELIATVAWLQQDLPNLNSLNERAASIGGLDESLFDQAEEALLETEESI